LAWFWVALLPASSVFPLAEVTNDHRMFFPFIGLAAAVVWWIAIRAERWSKERVVSRPLAVSGAAWATGMLVLSFHAIGTHARNRVWLSEETLWADVASKSPSNGRGL